MPTGTPSTFRREESMGALVNLNNTPYYVHFDFFRMSAANLVVIGLMLVVFALAVYLRAPGAKRARRPK